MENTERPELKSEYLKQSDEKRFRIKKIEISGKPTIYIAEMKRTFLDSYIQNIDIISFLGIAIGLTGFILFVNMLWFISLLISICLPLIRLKVWKKLVKTTDLNNAYEAIEKQKRNMNKVVTYIEVED